jgi:hypothetical protein
MKTNFRWTTRLLIAVLTFALCGIPELAFGQDATSAQAPTASGNDPASRPADQAAPSADANTTTTQQPDATAAAPSQDATPVPAQTQPNADPNAPARPGSMMDPAAGPLQPVPSTTLPNAPSTTQQEQTAQPAQPISAAPARQQQREPLGTATAEGARTVGGAASRPAGTAIAPAKQRQVRSWLIRLGAIAGAGVAIGTVYALSRGTSSTPPNAATGTQR